MQIMLILFLVAATTAVIILVGIVLLPWRRTRPFGLYALLVEPGAIAGLLLAAVLSNLFSVLIHHLVGHAYQMPDWEEWVLFAIAVLWFGFGASLGALSGFILATWLWWRFSPEPYRSKIMSAYKRFVAMPPIFRQRWNQRGSLDQRTE